MNEEQNEPKKELSEMPTEGSSLEATEYVPEKPAIENAPLSAIPSAAPPPKPKRKRVPSRADRWAEACDSAANAGSLDEAVSALEDLRAIQEEYESWKENLPEGLQSSALGEKLDTVCGIDIDGAIGQLQEVIDLINEAEGVDLPLGWGKD